MATIAGHHNHLAILAGRTCVNGWHLGITPTAKRQRFRHNDSMVRQVPTQSCIMTTQIEKISTLRKRKPNLQALITDTTLRGGTESVVNSPVSHVLIGTGSMTESNPDQDLQLIRSESNSKSESASTSVPTLSDSPSYAVSITTHDSHSGILYRRRMKWRRGFAKRYFVINAVEPSL